VLSGIKAPHSGRVRVGGREICAVAPVDPAEMRRMGMAHVPEDRLRCGMVGASTASETAILGYHKDPAFCRGALFNHEAITAYCSGLMERYDVRPRAVALQAGSFSGGNQQKLVLAREVSHDPRVLLVGQPTRGVDIGAIEFIHRQLLALRDSGCAILLVSVELQEVMALADRIVVMFGGRIVGEVPAARADERTLGLMMANAWQPGESPDTAGAGS
jgi:simple sugar transport system ATP-binding protein